MTSSIVNNLNEESSLPLDKEGDVTSDYKKLNEKCDKVITRIKSRKEKNKKQTT